MLPRWIFFSMGRFLFMDDFMAAIPMNLRIYELRLKAKNKSVFLSYLSLNLQYE